MNKTTLHLNPKSKAMRQEIEREERKKRELDQRMKNRERLQREGNTRVRYQTKEENDKHLEGIHKICLSNTSVSPEMLQRLVQHFSR